jgi:hypothetical protein
MYEFDDEMDDFVDDEIDALIEENDRRIEANRSYMALGDLMFSQPPEAY